jgi:hypothetical protein
MHTKLGIKCTQACDAMLVAAGHLRVERRGEVVDMIPVIGKSLPAKPGGGREFHAPSE